MPHNPTTRLQKRLEIIERHKAMLNALKAFVKKHPRLINEYRVKELQQGAKLGFKFRDYVLIVPVVKNDKVILQLWRSGEAWDWDDDALKNTERLAKEDVSRMSTKRLEELLHDIFKEANPEWEDENEQE
jgi:hypothetical protein